MGIKYWLALFGGIAAGGVALSRRLNEPTKTYPKPENLIVEPPTDIQLKRVFPLQFSITGETAMPVAIYAGIHPDKINRERALPISVEDERILVKEVRFLPSLHTYFELLHDTDEREVIGERFIPLRGAVNLRDVGGYTTQDGKRVRWGRLYRSGAPERMGVNEWAYMRNMGLKSVLDLRTAEEAKANDSKIPRDFQRLHIPLNVNDGFVAQLRLIFGNADYIDGYLGELYAYLLEHNPLQIREIMQFISSGKNQPLILHCTAGKDRTGVIVALLLDLLGVPHQTIIADYTLSNRYYDAYRKQVESSLESVSRFVHIDRLEALLLAQATTMQGFLAHVKARYGSSESYLQNVAGVPKETLNALKTLFLEEKITLQR